jgi:chorismate mutase
MIIERTSKEKLNAVWNKRPLIISGPCSAETEEQVLQTARGLASTGKVDVLRAGIWKPRTRPGGFEGVGAKGLPWLQKVEQETGLLTAVEVANAKQVQDALTFDVDILWIGARTTVNPFSIQEIADALRGADVPVLVKNPVSPDIELWSGAIERLTRGGIKNIGLVHRGFSSYGNSQYRNVPMWPLAIEMKLRYPDLPMITDPSHICGEREGIQEICQKAIDVNFDGLIIESHVDPDNAWSDAKQQITPQRLDEILSSIIWRKEDSSDVAFQKALEKLRQQINILDDELLEILAQRMKIADQIGQYKKDNNITILQPTRWHEIVDTIVAKGEKLGLSSEFLNHYLDAVHIESINHQKKIMDA